MMTLRRFFRIHKNQSGFTLLEILIGIIITGIIGGGITTAIVQIFDVNARSTSRMTAVKQVEDAVHWISRDVQQAQYITVTDIEPSKLPLTLTWVDWDNNSTEVEYSVENNRLQRTITVNSGQPATNILVSNLNTDSSMTFCDYALNVILNRKTFTMTLTSTVSGYRSVSETRSIEIIPRSARQ